MMENLTRHMAHGLNDLEIEVNDNPGDSGACHEYLIRSFEYADLSDIRKAESLCRANCRIHFQNGPIQEVGVNGITNEALLAIVEHRLEGFQRGPFGCEENGFALTGVKEALHWLHKRTLSRVERGVEGTHEP